MIAKVFKKNVRVEWKERDRYKRVLEHIHVDDRWINKDMVTEGWAWHYKKYSKDKRLAKAEIRSRSRRDGLGKDANPIPPWEYRKNPAKYARQLNRPDLTRACWPTGRACNCRAEVLFSSFELHSFAVSCRETLAAGAVDGDAGRRRDRGVSLDGW